MCKVKVHSLALSAIRVLYPDLDESNKKKIAVQKQCVAVSNSKGGAATNPDGVNAVDSGGAYGEETKMGRLLRSNLRT